MRLLGIVDISTNGTMNEPPRYTSLKSTIPKDVVELLKLKAGDKLVFCENNCGEVILRKNGWDPK